MKNDLVSINGQLKSFGDAFGTPDPLLSSGFVYQKINVPEYEVPYAGWHAEIAGISYKTLYGTDPELTPALLDKEIRALLTANRYPRSGGVLVALYIMPAPDGRGGQVRLLSCEKQLVFKGFALWNTTLRCIVLPYDYPNPCHKTAVSLAAHTYAADYARRQGADVAVCENGAGNLTCVGENPLFISEGRMVFTPALEEGVPDSVERRLVIEACHAAGVDIAEREMKSGVLKGCDEIFTATPQGIASIHEYGSHTYTHSLARHLAGFVGRTF